VQGSDHEGLKQAWAEVTNLVDRAERFGRFQDVGGQVVGWQPHDGEGIARDGAGRALLLYHKTFDPLTEAEAGSIGRPWLPGGLPTVIQRFLTTCSNGLEFAAGDLAILGYRRRVAFDPESGFSAAGRPGQMNLRFGRWGQEPLWMDLQTGLVGTGATGTRYLRSWPTFPEFLVGACREHLASFDADGRRIGFAALPIPKPPPTDLSFISQEWRPQVQAVETLLAQAPQRVKAGRVVFDMFRPAQLPAGQVGYSVDSEGNVMGGRDKGDWKPYWLVIGSDTALGDPLIVDLSGPRLRVITATHGAGRWDPVDVSDSLMGLLKGR